MTMYKTLHPRDDVARLFTNVLVSRKEWGRRLACIEDSVDASIQRLVDYIEKHEGGLVTATRNDTDDSKTNRMIITRKQKWEEKQLYRRFKRLINISHDKTWMWLRKGKLKRETESILISAQNNAIRTNNIKAKIDNTQQNSKCRLCGDWDETINHVISECSKLTQKEFKTRHYWVGKVIHWEMCKKLKFEHMNKWYMNNPAFILQNGTQTPMEHWHTNGSLNLDQKTRPFSYRQKKEYLKNCGLCCTSWP